VEHSKSKRALSAVFEVPLPKPRIHVEAGPSMGTSFPNKCRHCDPAPCARACPTGALQRDEAHGLVLVAADKCIACAMCAMVCPFDAVTFHPMANGHGPRVVAIKCDGCVERLDQGLEPACADACKTAALVYGDLNELIRAGRIRQSAAVLLAAKQSNGSELPQTVIGWRSFGEAVTKIAEEVSHEHSTSR
jgi:carbon-monoxide dehydrogenase iron sulfur subunit